MPERRRLAAAPQTAAPPGPDALYRLLVENVTDYAILMLSPEGRVVTWTEGAGRMTGYAEGEIVGHPVAVFYPPEDAASGTPERDLRIASAQGRCEAVAWRVRKDGSRWWASVTLTAVHDAEGRMVGFGQIMRDLTERKEVAQRYEESRQRYRSLFENNPDAICSFDLDGGLRTANPAAETLTGYAADDLVGAPFWTLVVPADRLRSQELFARAAGGEPQYAEAALTHCSGRRVELSVRLLPILVEGEIIGVYCIAEDITERKRAEAERETLLLRERSARAEAEAANAAKSDFLAVVTHELKTPLGVITGFAELLRDGEAGTLAEAQRRPVERIAASARQLQGIIDDVLAYTRMETAPDALRLERVELGELLGEAALGVAPLAREKGVSLHVERDGPCPAHTDRERVAQVLAHLLSNAVKFTEAGEVRAGARREAAALVVEVRDTGVGIAPEHLERIWEPFWQAENPLVRRAGGTGLGLSVARRLARLLGAEIEARSAPGEGSTFTLRLPLVSP
ncbi:MAG TPA: PAS domain S-box protein [Longimicrobium sp.]|nr:PAS domain S-box protein [Longimicrobium sp.]